MKTKKQKSITIGTGEQCPKCSKPMERRKHNGVIKNPYYYYSKWDYCKPCGHLQHYEEFKCEVWKEIENNKRFFDSL